MTKGFTQPITRRVVLKGSGGMMLTALVPVSLTACGGGSGSLGSGSGGAAAGAGNGSSSPPTPTQPVSFLSDAELVTLRAAVDRFIPGQPEDADPGAVVACCAEAISLFLGAFLTDPPFIYAGGPFSDRGGAPQNDFLEFIDLDVYEETAWRLLIEGSQGRPELEFNGPVIGAQQIYRDGLAQLDNRAGGSFANASAVQRDQILNDTGDAVVQAFVDIAYPDTLEFMYGPPEYGGNKNLVGWNANSFDGDVHPRGYTDDQVINADNPGLLDFLLPDSYGRGNNPGGASQTFSGRQRSSAVASPGLAAVVSGDTVAAAISAANGSRSAFKAQLAPWVNALINDQTGGQHA